MRIGMISFLCLAAIGSSVCTVSRTENAAVKPKSTFSVIHQYGNDRHQTISKSLNESLATDNCGEFFRVFPDNFEDFQKLYGFDKKEGDGLLYAKYEKHIPYAFACKIIKPRNKLRKALALSQKGRWEADASALLQDEIIKLINAHPRELRLLLDASSEEKASSFWFFVFDSPHPEDKAIVTRFYQIKRLLGERNRQVELMKQQYEKVKGSSAH